MVRGGCRQSCSLGWAENLGEMKTTWSLQLPSLKSRSTVRSHTLSCISLWYGFIKSFLELPAAPKRRPRVVLPVVGPWISSINLIRELHRNATSVVPRQTQRRNPGGGAQQHVFSTCGMILIHTRVWEELNFRAYPCFPNVQSWPLI